MMKPTRRSNSARFWNAASTVTTKPTITARRFYYLTLPQPRPRQTGQLADLDEMLLRTVPAVFGGALLLLLLFFGRSLADEARALAAFSSPLPR